MVKIVRLDRIGLFPLCLRQLSSHSPERLLTTQNKPLHLALPPEAMPLMACSTAFDHSRLANLQDLQIKPLIQKSCLSVWRAWTRVFDILV